MGSGQPGRNDMWKPGQEFYGAITGQQTGGGGI